MTSAASAATEGSGEVAGERAAGATRVDAAVHVRGLTRRYGDRTVLGGVDLDVASGEIVALLGPNGAGKTTTIEILEGYRRADTGLVRVLGADPAGGDAAWRARIGVMLQEGGIDPRATPAEALRLYGRLHADPRPAAELIEVVGLGTVAGTRYRRLSGGERQRLGLALALVGRPEVLFLDEPTAGMDPEARVATRALLLDLRSNGTAILLTTHDLGDVERIADRVVVLDGGYVVAEGRPGELGAASTGEVRVRLSSPVAPRDVEVLAARLHSPVSLASSDPSTVLLAATPSPALLVEVAQWAADAGLLIVELEAGTGSLEERYLALTRDAGRAPGADG